MNPNLAIFLKRSAVFAVICLLTYLLFLALKTYTQFSLDAGFAGLFKVFYYVVIAGMMALLIGLTLKEVWSGIMSRAERILLFCADKSDEGIHVVATHYHSGGDSGDGYTSYRHYFIRFNDGKIYMSKKLSSEKDLSKSLAHLSHQVGKTLAPVIVDSIEIGSYEDENDKPVKHKFVRKNGVLEINGFSHLLDYGFRLKFIDDNEKIVWTKKI